MILVEMMGKTCIYYKFYIERISPVHKIGLNHGREVIFEIAIHDFVLFYGWEVIEGD